MAIGLDLKLLVTTKNAAALYQRQVSAGLCSNGAQALNGSHAGDFLWQMNGSCSTIGYESCKSALCFVALSPLHAYNTPWQTWREVARD